MKNRRKIDYKWLISTVIAIFALFLAITNESSIRNFFGKTSIDFFRVTPYTFAGSNVENRNEFVRFFDYTYDHTDEYFKACNVRTYFNNTMASAYRISNLYIDIKEINPILEPCIDISAIAVDNCVHIYAINQSLAKEENIQIDIKGRYFIDEWFNVEYFDLYKYFKFINCASSISIDNIYGGEIIELFSFKIEDEGIELLDQKGWVGLETNLDTPNTTEKTFLGFLVYDGNGQDVHISKSEGYNDIAATFFAFVDANCDVGKYEIPMPTNPSVANDYNIGIDTVIVPNQSCDIKFSLIYTIGKDTIETDTIFAKIFVPLYNDDEGFYNSLLTYCIENNIKDYRRDTSSYLEHIFKYNVNTLLDEILN